MYQLLYRSAFFFLLASLLAFSSAAQIQYAKTVVDSQFTDAANDNLAVDSNPVTAGKLRPTLLGGVLGGLGSSYLRVGFASTVPPGQPAGIIIRPDNVVAAAVLSSATLTTYKKINATQTQAQEVFAVSTLLGVGIGLDKSAPTTLTFQPGPGKEFDQLELRVAGVNVGTDINFFEAFTLVSPLPVELVAFQGKATPAGVALKWSTASERNASYFDVQRTEQLGDDFRSVGRVASAGTSTQAHAYQFVDAAAVGLHYYRLRQVDVDGTEKFGPVVTVAVEPLADLMAYPTLASKTVTVTGPVGAHLGLFNQQGQQVQVADLTASQLHQLDVRSLPSGLYILRDTATGQRTRFVKVDSER